MMDVEAFWSETVHRAHERVTGEPDRLGRALEASPEPDLQFSACTTWLPPFGRRWPRSRLSSGVIDFGPSG
ncbi:hypothetical protein SCAB_88421 [Streptomyces scabiei 87.22]|uniref:Uncharacterized protein n=1 Tax=Streptomyces scabiei (strain 87.22) TaxID=680198 RepID=C9Z6A8_STRSW|nr:hypothetical protein IQ61_38230 [Streptomyces scabiei]CBG75778.1 hypothetical protein SCAB_88421 [Streptomyces scabiei 87.22]